jgi:hypothetical protein
VCEIVQNILIYKNVIGRRKKKECDEVQWFIFYCRDPLHLPVKGKESGKNLNTNSVKSFPVVAGPQIR